MKRLFFIILIMAVFASCKSQKPATCTPVKTVEKHITTLVPVYLPADSALLKAYLECDSANKVIMTSISEKKSGRIESNLSLQDNILNYRIKTVRDTVYAPSDSIVVYKEIPVQITIEKPVYKMTKLQQIFFYVGIIVSTALAVWLILKINFKELLNGIINPFK